MSIGRIDIFTSRRNNYNKCKYWINRDDLNPSDVDYKIDEHMDGTFYAKEVTAENRDYQVISGDFLAPQTNITLYTEDDVSDLTENSVVVYDDEVWRVKTVQKTKKKKQNQFLKSCGCSYYISMKR